METESMRCKAMTKSGSRCKNMARFGSEYCHIHAELDQGVEPAALTPKVESAGAAGEDKTRAEIARRLAGMQVSADAGLGLLVYELEQVALELQKRVPALVPRSLGPSQLVGLFNYSIGRYLPETQRELMKDVERNLADATFGDFAELETWQGLWTLISYSVQAQVAAAQQGIGERMAALPGANLFEQIKGNLEGTTPKDLIDPETWKGLLYVVYYVLQLQAQEIKQLMAPGSSDETTDDAGSPGTDRETT